MQALKAGFRKLLKQGSVKGNSSRVNLPHAFNSEAALLCPAGAGWFPKSQPSPHGPKQHRGGKGPRTTRTGSPGHKGQACLKRGWVFFIVSNGTGRLNKTRTDSQNPAFETKFLEWIIFYIVLIQGGNGAVE